MTASLGSVALPLAFLTAVFAAIAALLGRRGDERWVTVSRRAVYALCGLLTLCVVLIEIAFAGDDFSLRIVQQHSSVETPAFYKLAAMWSSQEGSLLLWAWVLSIASSAALLATRRRLRELVPYATAVMASIAAFFTGLMLFAGGVDPFATLSPAPPDGIGLTPLLQHPSMMIHPPMLYSGYVAFTIPFAFAVGALVTRRLDADWIRATRRFALIAWAFLGLGLLLGARWSYTELGWGGYWAWDPVENAALMPWLAGTAFLHSIMVQEKRGMLRVWNASLIVATFSLALLGTFLVRSGVLQSIHAFGDSTVGPYILGLIAVVLVGSAALIVARLDDLRSQKRIDSLASREAVFLVNNLLLVALCVAIFWGTFFPLISELFTGEKSSLAAPWFDRYTTPLAIGLVLFTGVGPLLAWRRVSWASAKRIFLVPALTAGIVAVALAAATDAPESPWAFVLFVFAAFALTGLAQEFWRGAVARRALSGGSLPAALTGMVTRNRRRYGGYIVHVGVIVLLVGIAASSSFQTKRDVTLRPGRARWSTAAGSATCGPPWRSTVRPSPSAPCWPCRGATAARSCARAVATSAHRRGNGDARQLLRRGGDKRGRPEGGRRKRPLDLRRARHRRRPPSRPRRRPRVQGLHPRRPGDSGPVPAAFEIDAGGGCEPAPAPGRACADRQPAIRDGGKVGGELSRRRAATTFRVIVDPLVTWIWIGGLIALCGALIAIWPARAARRRPGRDNGLEALKEAKYREIRDAELDHAAGKLSDEDFALLDAELRREAVAILDREKA